MKVAESLVNDSPGSEEYKRAILNMLARMFPVQDMDESTRMEEIAVELNW
jgi:hypothetical protein